jgi:hypothetical protein
MPKWLEEILAEPMTSVPNADVRSGCRGMLPTRLRCGARSRRFGSVGSTGSRPRG